VGFVWATMLWDMTWKLIDEYGFNADIYGHWTTGGNNLALQLVMDGMKFQPCNPGFVDARDAILAADDALTGTGGFFTGVNQCTIWNSFAVRGLGFGADQGDVDRIDDGTQAFDLPPACETLGAPIGSQTICQGETALFRIGAGNQFTAPPVTLSAVGAPPGTTVTFTPPAVASVPGISDLTIGNTGAAAAGTYNIHVTGIDTSLNVFILTNGLQLNVFDAPSGAGPGLTAPADGAIYQPILPTFTWTAIADASSYTLEIDDDPGFGSIDYTASGIVGLSHTPAIELDFLITYFWRVRANNPCGSGTDSALFSFTTFSLPDTCAGIPFLGSKPNDPSVAASTLVDRMPAGASSRKTSSLGPVADLAVDAMSPDFIGKIKTFGIRGTVTNMGPDFAINTVATAMLDKSVTCISTIGCAEDPGGKICNLGTLAKGETAEYCMVVLPSDSGLITNTISVSSSTLDINPGNNTDTVLTVV
ncbi:MAG: hypothetical protein GY778_04260, partial [bacterium]|nr:hypothetical protein [bacterium]